jgi:hypothetical protein
MQNRAVLRLRSRLLDSRTICPQPRATSYVRVDRPRELVPVAHRSGRGLPGQVRLLDGVGRVTDSAMQGGPVGALGDDEYAQLIKGGMERLAELVERSP